MKLMKRRQWLQASSMMALAGALAMSQAQATPELRQLQILVGIAPGGVADTAARVIAEGIPTELAGAAIVENRSGAGGQLALNAARSSAADGSTLVLTPASMLTIYPHIYPNLQYDPLQDFVPVSLAGTIEFGFAVGPMVPESVVTLADFFDWARANPAMASFGSPAAGSVPHFLGELVARHAGIPMVHVPYRGTQPAIADLIGGQVAAVSGTVGGFVPHLKDGRIRLLATSGSERSRFVPEVPTYAEQGLDELQIVEWLGVFAPAGSPPERVERLSAAIQEVLATPRAQEVLAGSGVAAQGSSPAVLDDQLRADYKRWQPIVETVGFEAM